MKQRTGAGPRARRYGANALRTRVGLGAAALLVVLACAGIALLLLGQRGGAASARRAVIVDQLAQTDPDPAFIKDATTRLQAAGYQVDYIPPADVTVDLYRTLPSKGYSLIMLRSHSSDFVGAAAADSIGSHAATALFTNEPYTTSAHVDEQRDRRLLIENYTDRPITQQYFGVGADFMALDTRGHLGGATVILMGCAGLKTNDLARAFVFKGAAHFVSWDASVTAQHTDVATTALLAAWLSNGRDLSAAIQSAMAEVGPDPTYHARLVQYP